MISREQIERAKDIKTEKVPTPEWAAPGQDPADAFVWVRGLTGAERDKFEASLIEARRRGHKINAANIRARMAVIVVVDAEENGNLLFKPTDVSWLGGKSAAVLDRIQNVANRLSGSSDEDMEDLLKNLERIPAEGSPSA